MTDDFTNAIPLPPISPPAPLPSPPLFRPPANAPLPPEASFPHTVPRDDLELFAEDVVRMVLDEATPFDEAIALAFVGGLENEVWGSTSGNDDVWSTELERAVAPVSAEILDQSVFQAFRAALASTLFRSDLLETVLRYRGYADGNGFVVSHEEVRERLRAIAMGEEEPSRNAFAWQRRSPP